MHVCLSLSSWSAHTCSCLWPSWWGYPMKKASPWQNWLARSSSSTSSWPTRNYPSWSLTGSAESRNLSAASDSGYLCVDLLPPLISHDTGIIVTTFFWCQVRSETISTYALCGFANFSSLGIMIGGLCEHFSQLIRKIIIKKKHSTLWHKYFGLSPRKASICPSRRGDISSLVLRAMITATCATLINACVAGKKKKKTKLKKPTSTVILAIGFYGS